MGKNQDKVVISFCDSIIRQSDLKLLEGPHWLNDRIIGFYFEYLFEKEFDSSDKLVFISPEVCQFLKMSRKEELEVFLEPLNLDTKDLIVLAVNNNDSERSGGSHWSLLMFSKQAREFFHFDSSSGMNYEPARQLASNTHSYLMSKLQYEDRYAMRIKEVPVIQQTNCYDCGIHVLCNAKGATRHMLIYGSDDGMEKLPENLVDRMYMKKIIFELGGIAEDDHAS